MLRKLYPADQIESYLFIDIIGFVFLAYVTIWQYQPLGIGTSIALYLVTALCFYTGLWQRGWLLVIASWAGLAVIAVYAVFYQQWLLLYGFMYADLLSRARTLKLMYAGMAGIAGMFFISYAILNGELRSFFGTPLLPFLILQLLMPYVIRTIDKARRLSTKLNAANRKLERYIQEEERHRIARDLHDTLGQTLTMIKMKSELAARLVDRDSARARSEIDEIKHSARHALQQVRELVASMRHIPLSAELDHVSEVLASAGIAAEVAIQNEPHAALTDTVQTMLALALREAVTNVVRHSGASRCWITGQTAGDSVYRMTIRDNGRGLAPGREGFGLPSIQERMRQIKGQALIAQASEGGTEVVLTVPVMPAQPQEAH
ncbi:sensor histidine kinase [Paenibacillus sambharensis]|uniref:histidine kinase n=1 Tax=Paenibacillus sambharensis TaxID=1803190 RepID=A0A2W1L7Z0_9BACL|nr:sensor histidine kinase [Paenibacillus sambharensis]PZD95376.1 sensor histidine kinase [Paenibacillus sambharensis]